MSRADAEAAVVAGAAAIGKPASCAAINTVTMGRNRDRTSRETLRLGRSWRLLFMNISLPVVQCRRAPAPPVASMPDGDMLCKLAVSKAFAILQARPIDKFG